MNMRPLGKSLIPAVAIIYVIVAVVAQSTTVWVVGALIVGLIAVVATGWSRSRTRSDDR